jgi:hypothetical protein
MHTKYTVQKYFSFFYIPLLPYIIGAQQRALIQLKNRNKALSWLFSLPSLPEALKVHNYSISNIATSLLAAICYNCVVASVFFQFNPIPSLVHADNA